MSPVPFGIPPVEEFPPLTAPPGPGGEVEAEGRVATLWLGADEYGQLAQTDTDFVLFYPLRYHGGFNVTIKRSGGLESITGVTAEPNTPTKLIEQLKQVLDVSAAHYPSLNLLIIKVPLERQRETVEKVKELLDLLDAPRKQVAIDAKIVEVAREVETQLGVDWSVTNTTSDFFRGATGGFNIPGSTRFGVNDFNLQFDTAPAGARLQLAATLRALEAVGKLNVISEPNLVVEVGQTARILVGRRVPIQTKWTGRAGSENITTVLEETGVRLFVTPLVVSEDTIRLHVMPEVSNVLEFRITGTGIENPVIDTRNAETVVSVQDGEFIKIAGLISNDKVKNEVKVPLLGDLPLLGFLFKSWRYETVQRDLIIYVTPRIVRGPLIQPGAGLPLGAGY